MKAWTYGDSWEHFPIEDGEKWVESRTKSTVRIADITRRSFTEPSLSYMRNADMVYIDPPWGTSMVRSFYTKAGIMEESLRPNFHQLADAISARIHEIAPRVCYIEMSCRHSDIAKNILSKMYPFVQSWPIRYYRKHPAVLLRGGGHCTYADFTGIDDTETPNLAVETDRPRILADFCMGRGLSAVAAFENNVAFVGTELNKRRLAVTIDRVAKLGGEWEKIDD